MITNVWTHQNGPYPPLTPLGIMIMDQKHLLTEHLSLATIQHKKRPFLFWGYKCKQFLIWWPMWIGILPLECTNYKGIPFNCSSLSLRTAS